MRFFYDLIFIVDIKFKCIVIICIYISMVWYKKLNPFYTSEPIEFEISEDFAKKLFTSIEFQVKKNFEYKNWYYDLQKKEQTMEKSLLQELESQICGHIMLATQALKQKLMKRRELENLLQDGNDLNRMLENMIIEFEATIDAIKLGMKYWDYQMIISKSEKYLKFTKLIELAYFDALIKKVRMIGVRLGFLPRIELTLNSAWPKLRQKEAISQYIDILRYQIYNLNNEIKQMERKTKSFSHKLKKMHNKFKKLEKKDKFEKNKFCGKHLSVTSGNLETWEYVNQNFEYANLTDHVRIIKLLDEISILGHHQLELNEKIAELEQNQADNLIIQNKQKVLEHELARKDKLLTQVAIENLTFRQDERFRNIVLSECPERENVIIQQLVQNEIELNEKVVELEQKIKTSSKQADLHKHHSRHVAKTLKTLIEYLEEVALEFLRDETSQREQICELREVLNNEQLDSLMTSLSEQELSELKLALDQGNIEEVLNKLNQNVINSRNQLYQLARNLTEHDLANLITGLPAEQLHNLAEAINQHKYDKIVNILREARSSHEKSENHPDTNDTVNEIIILMQSLCKNLE